MIATKEKSKNDLFVVIIYIHKGIMARFYKIGRCFEIILKPRQPLDETVSIRHRDPT